MKTDTAALGIRTIGDPVLATPAPEVGGVDEARRVFGTLTDALRQLQGAGLAAPQLGISIAAAVVEVHKNALFPDRTETPLICIANPTLLSHSEETVDDWEGCFSVPGYLGLVPRWTSIDVRYLDADGEHLTASFTDYTARVVQHEMDHLAGRVCLSRMRSMDSLTTVENFELAKKRFSTEETSA